MKNTFTYIALQMDMNYNEDAFDEVTGREEEYILEQLVRCAVWMYENDCYDEQIYFQIMWEDMCNHFTLDKNDIIEQLGTALKYFEDSEAYEFCADIKQLIDKIKNNI